MLLVHLHYPNADSHIGERFAECKQLFAVGELFLSDCERARLRRPIRAGQAETMVVAFALEGLAASQARAGLRRLRLTVHVQPVAARRPYVAGPRHPSALDQRPHHAQGDGLPAGQLLDRHELGRVRGADNVNPHLALRARLAQQPKERAQLGSIDAEQARDLADDGDRGPAARLVAPGVDQRGYSPCSPPTRG